MRSEFYRTLQALLRRGESPCLESSLDSLGAERLSWSGGSLGPELEGRCFTQTMTAPARLVICGGGHVARALAPAARAVGFAVTVLEDRPQLLDKAAFPEDTDLRCGDFAALLQEDFGPNPFFAIMTQGHAGDWACLERILNRKYAYVGMLGSKTKVAATRARLEGLGVAESVIDTIHSPIGLPIGAEGPAEIAVSIVAQLIQCRHELGLAEPLPPELIAGLDCFPYAMVTLVSCSGSTPRSPGARMLVFADGSIRGTVGGGAAEAAVTKQALQALKNGQCAQVTFRMNGGESICGGIADYLIIPVKEDEAVC